MINHNDDPKTPVDVAMTEIASATTEKEFDQGMEDLAEALDESQPDEAVDSDNDDWGNDDDED